MRTGSTNRWLITRFVTPDNRGERDPQQLAQYRHAQCKHDEAQIAAALTGNYRRAHLFALQQAVALYEMYGPQVAAVDAQMAALYAAMQPVGSLIDAMILASCASIRDDAYTQLSLSDTLPPERRDAWLAESSPIRSALADAYRGERLGFWRLYAAQLLRYVRRDNPGFDRVFVEAANFSIELGACTG